MKEANRCLILSMQVYHMSFTIQYQIVAYGSDLQIVTAHERTSFKWLFNVWCVFLCLCWLHIRTGTCMPDSAWWRRE